MFCATGCSVNPDSVIERLKKEWFHRVGCWLFAESLKVFVCLSPCPGSTSTYLCPVSTDSPSSDAGFVSPVGSLDLVTGGNTDAGSNKQTNNNIQTSANKKQRLETNQRRRDEANNVDNMWMSPVYVVFGSRLLFIFTCLHVFCG